MNAIFSTLKSIIVTNNVERHMLNEMQVKRWAKLHNKPLFFFYVNTLICSGSSQYETNGEHARALSTKYDKLDETLLETK